MSRASWKNFECDVANYIGEQLGIATRTGRAAKRGLQADSDLEWCDDDGRWWPGIRGWTIEAKLVKQSGRATTRWLGQARTAAFHDGNLWWAVVWKDPDVRTSIGDVTVWLPGGMLTDYLTTLEPSRVYPTKPYVGLTLAAWCEVAA